MSPAWAAIFTALANSGMRDDRHKILNATMQQLLSVGSVLFVVKFLTRFQRSTKLILTVWFSVLVFYYYFGEDSALEFFLLQFLGILPTQKI